METESSGGDVLAAQNSKSAEILDGIVEGGDDHEKRSGEVVGGFKGGNSGERMEDIDAEASSDPKTPPVALLSDDLREIPVEYGFDSAGELKGLVTLTNEEVPKTIANETAAAFPQNVPVGNLSSELSPTSVTQFVSSLPTPAQTEHIVSLVEKRCISPLQVESVNSFDPNNLTAVKTPSSDGYNWRKYGQKQVKSPLGSRSYYRCTHAECYAKKIECSDQFHRVLEIVYKSNHSHDPPQKVNCTRLNRLSSPVAPVNRNKSPVSSMRPIADSVPSTSPVVFAHDTATVTDPKQKESRKFEETVKQEHIDELEPRKRLKKTDSSCPESPSKAVKKPKLVVHAAGDVGISGDGFRWRKYGQKMVKGNPHPRNYYRCTSAGCPVRKHIEMSRDDKNASIITYKGVHDHDMPVPKKRHGPPSAPLVAAAAPTSTNSLQVVNTEHVLNQESATQWPVDKEGELKGQALECGVEKPLDSSRALLSVGFEVKPC